MKFFSLCRFVSLVYIMLLKLLCRNSPLKLFKHTTTKKCHVFSQDGYVQTWAAELCKALESSLSASASTTKGKWNQKLCVCVSEEADSWEHLAPPATLLSLAVLLSSAFNKTTSCCSANQDRARICAICGDIRWPFKRWTTEFKCPDETEDM